MDDPIVFPRKCWCGKAARARGLCKRHYDRLRYRAGRKLPPLPPKNGVHNFKEQVVEDSQTDCWNFKFINKHNGYGYWSYLGKPRRAHRLAYQFFIGRIPKGKFVLHRCDNKACVNPDHLFVGSPQDNMTDKVLKGRQARGERHGMVRLAESEILSIRKSSKTPTELASIYKIKADTVRKIKARRLWSWL